VRALFVLLRPAVRPLSFPIQLFFGVRIWRHRPCLEKVNLATLYKITTVAYSYAVSELERGVRAFNTAGFEDLFRLARSTGKISYAAGEDFESHVSGYGC
jgi:hypothetical protein